MPLVTIMKSDKGGHMSKRDMFDNFNRELTSDDMPFQSDMYYAMYAYEMHGDATRDNSFIELVSIGKDLEKVGQDDNEIVADLRLSVVSIMHTDGKDMSINFIVKTILKEANINPRSELRRAYDGMSQADWLVEKMIGEFLIDGKVNL